MTQIMKPHMRKTSLLKQSLKMPEKLINAYEITIVISEYQIHSFPFIASFYFHLVLRQTMIFQHSQGDIGKHDLASTCASFGIMLNNTIASQPIYCMPHMKHTSL